MAEIKESFALARLTRFLGFLIGIFGAMAILGVFFRIVDWGPYEYFMWVGFMGEAAAFVIMGLLELVAAFMMKEEETAGDKAPDQASHELIETQPAERRTGTFRDLIPEGTSEQMNTVMEAFTGEVERFGTEMREMVQEMQQARTAMQGMRGEITALAGGSWAEEAEKLGYSLQNLSEDVNEVGREMEGSREAVKRARTVLDQVASSNLEGDAERFEKGMNLLSQEVLEMGKEMGPARKSVQNMRAELDKVVSGDLAGDAQKLGSGMRSLGNEMEHAGNTVEQIRDDLDHMAQRFRQFNQPMIGNGEASRSPQSSENRSKAAVSENR